RIRADLAQEIATLNRKPCLAVLMVGEDPASLVYVRNRAKACASVGIETIERILPADASENTVLLTLEALNKNPTIDGIIIESPLPKHLNRNAILKNLRDDKDVDGASVANAGKLFTAVSGLLPCTPRAVMRLIEETGVPVAGSRTVVVGRSPVVGKPMAMMLLAKDATVTVAHSKTRHLEAVTKEADILVVAAGRAGLITADMVKPGALVIDVGINVNQDGKMTGDVDFESVKEVAGWITPVPGGVGPVTVAMLLLNTFEASKRLKK
ncbi:MAG TPA: bifunctional 5,10-methylene-tetrahydrofolate dehydrogenase/5,10-methylene-tetrahydrofolate cyclohydrolase, partial [Sutterella sp.]|nr:bifunctional 5,10-methylene-tetrahydrofolate dehydrogenase/5,10-methylene-tetrahydrofolate cyclohydrolase [Sutterella sp.]